MTGGFYANTRLVNSRLETKTGAGGAVLSWTLPKIGFLSHLYLRIKATVTGTLSNQNALGVSSIIRSVRLSTNSAIDIFSLSGAAYAYLLDEMMESELSRVTGQNNGRAAVTAAVHNLDMVIPVALNIGNPLGTLMLQNEQTVVTLTAEIEAAATVATGATLSVEIEPVMWYYMVPADPRDFPRLDVLHTIIEDTQAVAATGVTTYVLPRGYTYVGVAHGYGIGASGSDKWSRIQVRVGQNQFPYDLTPDLANMLHYHLRGRARPSGAIYIDYLAQTGQGTYGQPRDLLNSSLVTDLAHLITTTNTDTLRTVRRQLVPLVA